MGTLAPSASRYFGRNFFHNSSPNPNRKTAPEAMVTFRSRLRNFWSRANLLRPLPGRRLLLIGETSLAVERGNGQRVKLAPHRVDVCEGQLARVRSIRQQQKDTL